MDARQKAVRDAERAKDAECGAARGGRGNECRKREEELNTANAALSAATNAKTQTDRARELEALLAAERKKLARLGSLKTVDPQGSAMAQLFNLPESDAGFLGTVQQFGIVLVVDLIIIACLITWEKLPRSKAHRAGQAVEVKPEIVIEPAPIQPRAEPEVAADIALSPMTGGSP